MFLSTDECEHIIKLASKEGLFESETLIMKMTHEHCDYEDDTGEDLQCIVPENIHTQPMGWEGGGGGGVSRAKFNF